MKKYLVIGNPIQHSLSPKLHNYWIRQNNIKAVYESKLLGEKDLKEIIQEIKNDTLSGINVTVPFKNLVTPYLDELLPVAKKTGSVNTIFKKNNKIYGENTDAGGFQMSLEHIGFNAKGKKAFIIGAGGVAPSIIYTLKKMGIAEIALSNRTRSKSDNLKKIFKDLKIIDWGNSLKSDLIINATSLGLNENDEIKIDFETKDTDTLFYDVIYSPNQTKFLTKAKKLNNKIQNGNMMFIYQAYLAFSIWHDLKPKIDNNVVNLLSND